MIGVGPVESLPIATDAAIKLSRPRTVLVIINLTDFMRFLAQNVNCWDESLRFYWRWSLLGAHIAV